MVFLFLAIALDGPLYEAEVLDGKQSHDDERRTLLRLKVHRFTSSVVSLSSHRLKEISTNRGPILLTEDEELPRYLAEKRA